MRGAGRAIMFEAAASYFAIFLLGCFVGSRVSSNAWNKALNAFKEDVKRFKNLP
jgi:hypothetical protein